MLASSAKLNYVEQGRTYFYAKINISLAGFSLYTTALFDSGSDKNIIALHHIPESLKKHIAPTEMTFTGVGKIKALGTIEVILKPHTSNFKFHHVKFYVVREQLPTIIGKAFIVEHETLSPGKFNLNGNGLELFLKSGRKVIFPWTDESRILFARQNGSKYENYSTQQKLEILRKEKGIEISDEVFKGENYKKLVDLIWTKRNVFKGENDPLGEFSEHAHIPTLPGLTKSARPRPIPKHLQAQVRTEIQKMLDSDVIEECPDGGGFHSPLHIVPKKNGKIRICSDFKQSLNKCLSEERDIWNIPVIDCLFSDVGAGHHIFSDLDISSAYWNVKIAEEDRYKTNFLFENKLYMYKRMPFGLTHSGDSFNKMIAKLLSTVKSQGNFVHYIDDILCYSKDEKTHLEVLAQIFDAVESHGARLGGQKCNFGKRSTRFMGREISPEGIGIPKDCLDGLQALKPPTNRKELMSILGSLCWWKSWISANIGEKIVENCFSQVIKEMSALNKAHKEFKWTKSAQVAFDNAKKMLGSGKVFSLPDFREPFCVICDASAHAVGAALMQKIGGKQKIVAVFSKTLTETQSRWSATEREGYGCLLAIEKFSYYLMGRGFLVLTDHKALCALDRKIIANDKLSRWQARLRKYSFTVQYIQGAQNNLADMLSRPWAKIREKEKPSEDLAGEFYNPVGDKNLVIYIPSWCCGDKFPRKMLLERTDIAAELFVLKSTITDVWAPNMPIVELRIIECAQTEDQVIGRVKNFIEKGTEPEKWTIPDSVYGVKRFKRFAKFLGIHAESGCLTINWGKRTCLVLPKLLVPKYLQSAHGNGHGGVDRTAQLLSWCWWPDMAENLREFVATCEGCLRRKGYDMQKGKPDRQTLFRATRPWQILYIDFINMPKSRTGKAYCLTVMDGYSRFLSVYPTARCRAQDAATALMRHILLYDFPSILSSDQGTHFKNELMEELCGLLGIQRNIHVAFRPESTGCLERSHKVLKNALYGMALDKNTCWEMVLPAVTNMMNSCKNRATGVSPFECIYGRVPSFKGIQMVENPSADKPATYAYEIAETLKRTRKFVDLCQEEADLASKQEGKSLIKPQILNKGDKVLLNRSMSAEAKAQKNPWIGPFEVINTNGVVVQLEIDGKVTWVHRYHCMLYKDRPRDLDPDFVDDLYDNDDATAASKEEKPALRRSTRARKPVERFTNS